MIVTPNGSNLRFVTQVDHAHFAAELGRLWRKDGMPEHPRRASLLLAVREHDNGWQEADAAPSVDPHTGHPIDFLHLPDRDRFDVWQRGVERMRSTDVWAALLIGRHAAHLARRVEGPDWDRLFEAIDDFERTELEALGRTEIELDEDYAWLHRLDALSLAACGAWEGKVERPDIRAECRADILRLDPFPLAGRTTLEISVREIESRRFESSRDLAVELASTKWQRLPIAVASFE